MTEVSAGAEGEQPDAANPAVDASPERVRGPVPPAPETTAETAPKGADPAPVADRGNPPETEQAATAHPASENQGVAELQQQIRRLTQREAASREALDTLKTMMQARAARPQVTYLGANSTGAFTAPAPAVSASISPSEDADTARQRAKLQQQVQQLEGQLASERKQRQDLEAQLKQLRAETTVSPFADSISDELVAARRKVQGLEAALTSAQRARDDFAEKYEDLKKNQSVSADQDAETQAQIAVFEQRQAEALQGLERELAASQAREHELRQAVAETEQAEGEVSYALVSDLRAENAALKAKLQEAHNRNTALVAKLKTASRVADMIFKERAAPPERAPKFEDEPRNSDY